jgi:hypothetical protein
MVLDVLAGIAFDPQIRGILATAVGVVVLMGSVHLLLGTNLGNRLGFLVAAAGFMGWMFLMGLTWWAYGTIGMLGTMPSWNVQEVLYPTTDDAALAEARQLDTSQLPDPDELQALADADDPIVREQLEPTLNAGWRVLPESDPSFGEAKATVDEFFLETPNTALGIAGPDDYVSVFAFERGGKDGLPPNPSRLDRITTKLKTTFWQVQHPTRHAIVQIQPVIEQTAEPGEPPPIPEADSDAPVVTVVMVRDLGDLRFPAAMITIASGLLFWVLCVALHRRDQRVVEVRGMLPAPAEA